MSLLQYDRNLKYIFENLQIDRYGYGDSKCVQLEELQSIYDHVFYHSDTSKVFYEIFFFINNKADILK